MLCSICTICKRAKKIPSVVLKGLIPKLLSKRCVVNFSETNGDPSAFKIPYSYLLSKILSTAPVELTKVNLFANGLIVITLPGPQP